MDTPRHRPHWTRDRWTANGPLTSLARARKGPELVLFEAEPGPVEIDLGRTAFIIIDMQNDFLHADGWFADMRGVDVSGLAEPIGPINALAAALRRCGVPVVHVNWGVRADLANLPATVLDKPTGCGATPAYGDAGKRGAVLVEGSWGAASTDAIEVAPEDITVSKHRLSGFRDNELAAILRRLDVTTVLYAGVNTDRCVFATLMDGTFEGFDPILVTDACATVADASVTDAILTLVRSLYGFTATSDAIIPALPASS